MLSDEILTDYSYIVSARFDAINSHYIKLMGEQIREIGQLSPSNLHRLEQMARMSQNVDEINKLLAVESNRTVTELQQIYQASGMSIYRDASRFYMAKGVTQVPFNQNKTIQRYLEAMRQNTANTFSNLARTTVVRKNYQDMVDMAIDAVTTGVADYNSVIRGNLNNIAKQGLSVKYASGIERRLDSAVRMNVLEGIRQTNNAIRMITGEEFGADGVEISAHALCATDHLDIQGQQYAIGDKDVTIDGVTYESFNQMNDSLDRPISTLNCKHITYPIVLGISEPAYTDDELQAYKDNSQEEFTVNLGMNRNGTQKTATLTKYEATQLMRKYETAMRYAKDEYIASESINDDAGMYDAQKKLGVYNSQYDALCKQVGLEPKLDRAYVSGFNGRQIKPKPVVVKPTPAPTPL